jgi:putative heme degradation protein
VLDINEKVLLLAIYKKESDESIKDVLLKMENTKVFSLKDAKQYLKILKSNNYIQDGALTMVGEEMAKQVELEFKI